VFGEVLPFESSLPPPLLLLLLLSLLLLPPLVESVLLVGCYVGKRLNSQGSSTGTNGALLASTVIATRPPREAIVVGTMYVVVVQQSSFRKDGESGEENER